jgi:hypothetical protein
MTAREGAIATAYTSILFGNFNDFHKYAEELCGRPIFTHEFASEPLMKRLKELSMPDFLAIPINNKDDGK